MKTIQNQEIHRISEHEHHRYTWMGILRILFGVVLFIKGVNFIGNPDAILEMLSKSRQEFWMIVIAHYVAFAHLVGGVMIAFGLYTRLAAAVQIPVLIGAIVFVNWAQGFSPMQSELLLSVIVLALLVVFLFYGSGPVSVDEKMRNDELEESR